MSIENNELLLLDALVYYASLSDEGLNDAENITIGKFIDNLKKDRDNYETVFDEILCYADEDLGMDDIIEYIEMRGELKDLVMVYPESSKLLSTSSICLVDPAPDKLDVYVIYVGNYADSPYKYESQEVNTWVNNVMGAIQSDTEEQKIQLDFYNASIEAARTYFGEEKQNEDLNITVSGHSVGGNYAQYVTITYKEYMGEDYKAINDIDKCVSFDSQGFSFEFLNKYSQAIENRADKITSYCPTEATVGGCMSSIPGIEEKCIYIGFPNAFPIGYHMPAEMLNEKGEFKPEGNPSLEYILLKNATTCTLAIAENLPGIDVGKTLTEVGEFISAVANKGDVLGEGKDLIFSKDSIIVLGILLKELEPLVDLNKATLGITVAGVTINEIDNCIEEIGNLVESGDIIQAIDKADETFRKVRLGLQLYQWGMLTGNQVIAATNFIIGWNAGKLENKIRTTIRDKVCEATVYVCKEIYEAGEAAYDAGKKAGKYVKKKLNKLWDNVCDALGICDDDYKSASSVQRYIPDPLVIDLDFDGFELKNVEDGVYFDNNNIGHLEKTQWVSSDDGLLALDLNMDGLINDGSELFGTSTFMQDGTLAKSGFEALSQ